MQCNCKPKSAMMVCGQCHDSDVFNGPVNDFSVVSFSSPLSIVLVIARLHVFLFISVWLRYCTTSDNDNGKSSESQNSERHAWTQDLVAVAGHVIW